MYVIHVSPIVTQLQYLLIFLNIQLTSFVYDTSLSSHLLIFSPMFIMHLNSDSITTLPLWAPITAPSNLSQSRSTKYQQVSDVQSTCRYILVTLIS